MSSQLTQVTGKRKFGIAANGGKMKYPKTAKKQSSALNAQVLKVLNRHREKKVAVYSATGVLNSYTSTGWSATTALQALTPYSGYVSIAQGTGQGDRIGNRIEIKRAKIKILFSPTPYNVTTNPAPYPQIVKGWIVAPKQSTATPSSLGTFFQTGDASTAPVGTSIDCTRPVNTDQYTLYREFMKKVGYSANTGTGTSPNNANMANNDFLMNQVVEIDVTKYLPKYVEYNDTTGIPTSKAVWLIMESVNYDGGTYGGAGYLPTAVNLSTVIEFYDA